VDRLEQRIQGSGVPTEDSTSRHPGERQSARIAGQRSIITLAVLVSMAPAAWSAPVVIEGTGSADVIDVASASVPHEIHGRGDDDRITGSSAADFLDGGYGYDRLNGGPGDDTLFGGPGNDTLDGGSGTDVVQYTRARASYSVTGSAAQLQIRALAGSDGTDAVTSVESVDFSDGRYAVADLLDPPANRNPVALSDTAETAPNLPVIIEVLANDTDPDGDALRVGSVVQPAHGATVVNTDGSVTYTPDDDYVGTDDFSYTVLDDRGGSDTAAVSIVVRTPSSGDALLQRIAAAPEGSWIKVNVNRYEEVWTPPLQRARVNGVPVGTPLRIITAWSSMTWDGNRRQLIIWGGGHANYAGNDVYRFDAASLRWQRASLPSAVHAPFGDWRYFAVDGTQNAPISSHTYDNQEFLPLLDRFITFGGASYNTGQPFVLDDGLTKTGPYLWDPSRAGADMVGGTDGSQVNAAIFPNVIGARMWMNRDAVVTNGIGAVRPGSFVNGTSAYVVEQGIESVLVTEAPQTGGDLFRYRITDGDNPVLDSWELIGPGLKSYSDQGAGAYDPSRRLYLRTARMGTSYGIVMWNVATPGTLNYPIKFLPSDLAGQFVLSKLHGMDFDSRRSVFVLWDGDGKVWHLRPPASGPAFSASGWTVTPAAVAGDSVPALQMSTGILGKWKYIRGYDVMMGLGGGYEGQVWVYKPVGWQPPP
jgi:Ca2+-binding RTX toxin-like protein